MTEDRKHQLDELSVTDILSYLGARASTTEEHTRRTGRQFTRAKELLTRFVMASVYFNGKEADLVEETEQFLKEVDK